MSPAEGDIARRNPRRLKCKGILIIFLCFLVFAHYDVLSSQGIAAGPFRGNIAGMRAGTSSRAFMMPNTINASNEVSGNYEQGIGVRLYPFTQFGPNNQVFGFLQALTLCRELGIQCVEPFFSPHHTERSGAPVEFSQVYDLPADLKISRRDNVSVKLDLIITFYKHGALCWPKERYWENHRVLNFSSPENLAGVVHILNMTGHNREHMELMVLQKLSDIISNSTREDKNLTVGLIYCDTLTRPIPATRQLAKSFEHVSSQLMPARKYTDLAFQVMTELSLQTREYIALHLRLKDNCNASFEECCCESHVGSRKQITPEFLKTYILRAKRVTGKNRTFISGSPVLATFTENWDWTDEFGVVMWFAQPSDMLQDYEESIIHQLICSKAHTFYKSVESTWSEVVQLWQQPSQSSNSELSSLGTHS